MSEVWRAEDETLHRTVAVKVILEPIAKDTTYRERFLREARLVAGLEHANILPVYDFGTAQVDGQDVSYLVMPLVTGGSLKERISGPAPFPVAIGWLAAVAQALDHAHAKGILHRDVKPGNVLLDASGRVLLADFGLARAAEATSGLTATGTVLGTPLYMAPEQASGQTLDARADQYALAVIAFELLSGRVPFRADSPLAVLHQHVASPPPPLSSVRADAPTPADAVLARALAKSPAARFSSCAEFVSALAASLGVALSGPTAPWVPVPPREAVAASTGSSSPSVSQEATVVSAPAVPAPGPSGPQAPSPLAAPASAASAPRRRLALAALAGSVIIVAAVAGFLFFRRTAGVARLASTESAAPPVPTAANPLQASSTTAPTAAAPSEASTTSVASVPSTASEIPPSPQAPQATPPAEAAPPAVAQARPPSSRPAERRPRETLAERRTSRAERPGRVESGSRPLARREPLLGDGAALGDPALSSAYDALDTTRRTGGRLEKSDFASALGAAREALSRRPTSEVRFVEAFSRAGVSFANGDTATAWQLLSRALADAPADTSRTFRFVGSLVRAYGPNPGPDAGWILGLAFANVRGDLDEELQGAEEKAPGNARIAYARALFAHERGDEAEASRYARHACGSGLREACGM